MRNIKCSKSSADPVLLKDSLRSLRDAAGRESLRRLPGDGDILAGPCGEVGLVKQVGGGMVMREQDQGHKQRQRTGWETLQEDLPLDVDSAPDQGEG